MSIQAPRVETKKDRGAFFTPPDIARYLVHWAVRNPSSVVVDPTCGDGAFLAAAVERLRDLGQDPKEIPRQVLGIDIDPLSLSEAQESLASLDSGATLICGDIFDVDSAWSLSPTLPEVDAVIGNPPFIRYHRYRGAARARGTTAALAQGVTLSGLASSWAAVLIHAASFLRPEGRMAMVVPAELLTVGYADPIREWLRDRFEEIDLIMLERLHFEDALEKVALLLAAGRSECLRFRLHNVQDTTRLPTRSQLEAAPIVPMPRGKWTGLLLSGDERTRFEGVNTKWFVPLQDYGAPELGTVTGANRYFAITEAERTSWGLEEPDVRPIAPPGTRYLKGTIFRMEDWATLRDSGHRVWLFAPPDDSQAESVRLYAEHGRNLGIDGAYKCRIRNPWWRPPVVSAPDLFFTYMSHRFPRLVANDANVTFLNSMHGVRLGARVHPWAKSSLPILALNSVTMLSAELEGRSYGGGVLKMEPREAGRLSVPNNLALSRAAPVLVRERETLESSLHAGDWESVVRRVDEVLLEGSCGVAPGGVEALSETASKLRIRRLAQ